MTQKTFPIRYLFPLQVPMTLPRTVFPTTILRAGVRIQFRSRGTTGSSMFDKDFDHLCCGRRIHTFGHSDLRILSNLGASSNLAWVWADTASAACPSQSVNLAITSITFAAATWDADERCSVKTAWAPESSFTMSPRNTTLPLHFC